MTKADEVKFTELMMGLAEVFDSGSVSPVKVEIYFRVLAPYDIGQVEAAVMELIKTRAYNSFPKPAEIIQAISGTVEDRAVIAWEKLQGAMRSVGPYNSIQFDDPVIHSIVDFWGGWEFICSTFTENEAHWKQREFEKLYATMEKRGNHPQRLIGIVEAHNATRFPEHVPDTVMIGFNGDKPQIEDKGGKGLKVVE